MVNLENALRTFTNYKHASLHTYKHTHAFARLFHNQVFMVNAINQKCLIVALAFMAKSLLLLKCCQSVATTKGIQNVLAHQLNMRKS